MSRHFNITINDNIVTLPNSSLYSTVSWSTALYILNLDLPPFNSFSRKITPNDTVASDIYTRIKTKNKKG